MTTDEATLKDVAEYIMFKVGETSIYKLEKLLYYCQAWSLVWDDAPLFKERIEAHSINGPSIPALHELYPGYMFRPIFCPKNSAALSAEQRSTIDYVVQSYGWRSTEWLRELSCIEHPFLDASKAQDGAFYDEEITHESMRRYYSLLTPDNATPLKEKGADMTIEEFEKLVRKMRELGVVRYNDIELGPDPERANAVHKVHTRQQEEEREKRAKEEVLRTFVAHVRSQNGQ